MAPIELASPSNAAIVHDLQTSITELIAILLPSALIFMPRCLSHQHCQDCNRAPWLPMPSLFSVLRDDPTHVTVEPNPR